MSALLFLSRTVGDRSSSSHTSNGRTTGTSSIVVATWPTLDRCCSKATKKEKKERAIVSVLGPPRRRHVCFIYFCWSLLFVFSPSFGSRLFPSVIPMRK